MAQNAEYLPLIDVSDEVFLRSGRHELLRSLVRCFLALCRLEDHRSRQVVKAELWRIANYI